MHQSPSRFWSGKNTLPLPEISAPRSRRCKICGATAPVVGEVDFNKCCAEPRGVKLSNAGAAISYNRCVHCGFLFTDAFENWSMQDFRRHIYNSGYAQVDPEYEQLRPAENARMLLNAFGGRRIYLSVLDFGGGNGMLARTLTALGFLSAETYDPFTGFAATSRRKYDLVTCFEVLEHVPDPAGTVGEIADHVARGGLVLFSTLILPANGETLDLAWWYVAPRNGHISLYSQKTLALLWRNVGFVFGSFSGGMHWAFRETPEFARHLFRMRPENG
jgi:SAM-dependent methyltransferase